MVRSFKLGLTEKVLEDNVIYNTAIGVNTKTRYRFFISDDVIIEYNAQGQQVKQSYSELDHLGTMIATFDQQGQITQSTLDEYDPFGFAQGGDGTAVPIITFKGFTGHEGLGHLGVVHMGGRVYDPSVGRFLQADIVVQNPGYLVSFNRYVYVLNNPLGLVDPSGYYGVNLQSSQNNTNKNSSYYGCWRDECNPENNYDNSWATDWFGDGGFQEQFDYIATNYGLDNLGLGYAVMGNPDIGYIPAEDDWIDRRYTTIDDLVGRFRDIFASGPELDAYVAHLRAGRGPLMSYEEFSVTKKWSQQLPQLP